MHTALIIMRDFPNLCAIRVMCMLLQILSLSDPSHNNNNKKKTLEMSILHLRMGIRDIHICRNTIVSWLISAMGFYVNKSRRFLRFFFTYDRFFKISKLNAWNVNFGKESPLALEKSTRRSRNLKNSAADIKNRTAPSRVKYA